MISRFAKVLCAMLVALFLFASVSFLRSPTPLHVDPWSGDIFGEGGVENKHHAVQSEAERVEDGNIIMPHLPNATAKAALGRATWKLLHTMTLRYPEHPTTSERDALKSFFHLTARLYPCGECAAEFQDLLRKFPPQTSSRRAAALWLCSLHNIVNVRLNKPEFDCANLDSEYDCGCGDPPLASSTGQDQGRDEQTGATLVKGG